MVHMANSTPALLLLPYFADVQPEKDIFSQSHGSRHIFLNYSAVSLTFAFSYSLHLLVSFSKSSSSSNLFFPQGEAIRSFVDGWGSEN